MKVLFTGGSSFTGMWFIRELAAAGHQVAAAFRRPAGEYADPVRRRRVALAHPKIQIKYLASRFNGY